MTTPRALVLVSGGIDSAVALAWARKRYGADAIVGITFHYHERPEREVEATRAVARAVGVHDLVEVWLPFLREVADMGHDLKRNPGLDDAPEGYVPARNLVVYAIAAYHAEALGASVVVGGHHGADPVTFPDASPDFFARLSALVRDGLWSEAGKRFEVALPLAKMTKREVVALGLDLGAPLAETWSCYWDGVAPCGTCPSCVERREAFEALGAPDPGAPHPA